MKILAIDTSSQICSVSILEDKNLIIEKHNNNEKTHSQKLMPIIDDVFKEANLTLDNINLLACSQGPGSFTGIRIGISTIKAFADVKNIPVIGVTSLESLAYNITKNGLISSMIDAKHDNVYFALYEKFENCYSIVENPILSNINSAINILKKYSNKITFVGNGSVAYKSLIQDQLCNIEFANENQNIQTSVSIGLSAFDKFNTTNYLPKYTISPIYLKKSEAEISLEKKNINN